MVKCKIQSNVKYLPFVRSSSHRCKAKPNVYYRVYQFREERLDFTFVSIE